MSRMQTRSFLASGLTLAMAVSAVSVVALSGCAPGAKDIAPWIAPPFVDHPVLGRIDQSEVALLGPDTNQNGVRDQLDTYISSTIAPAAAPAATAYSLALTRTLIDGKRNAASPQDAVALARTAACLDAATSDGHSADKIRTIIVSTPARADAQARFSAVNPAPSVKVACS